MIGKLAKADDIGYWEFNSYLDQMYSQSFGIRAGSNFGRVIIGNFEIGAMNKVAAIGDPVNMASRTEAANKEFGTKLLISQSAYELVDRVVESRNSFSVTL